MQQNSILLVGAGPIGIELAVALKREGFSFTHIEAGCLGATVNWYAPGTQFFSSSERIQIANVPLGNLVQQKATKEEYLLYLRQVVRQFDLKVCTYERVTAIRRGDGGFEAETATTAGSRRVLHANVIILAIGDMHHPVQLAIPGEDLPHVSHYFQDPHSYFGQKVTIVGGRNSAVEAAIRLYRVGASVTLSYRRADINRDRIKYWLLPELLSLVKRREISFLPETEIVEISANDVVFRHIGAESTAEITRIESDSVLLLTGYRQNKHLFKELGITLEGEGERPRYDPLTMETDVSGVFVCGTAAAGSQLGGIKEFIETSHIHVDRIIAALKGDPAPTADQKFDLSLLER